MSLPPPPPQALIDEFVGVAHGDFDKVKELLGQNPGLLNALAAWGESALGAAAQTGRVDIAEYLLAAGAPLDICTAAMLGRTDTVRAALAADPAEANAKGAHGLPVLYHAVIGGHKDIADLLLAHGAELNTGDGASSPLHGAAAFGRGAMVAWLLAHGANPAALDYEGKTPLDRANPPDTPRSLKPSASTTPNSPPRRPAMARVVHFEILADDPERAVSFYEKAFDWKTTRWSGPQGYWLMTTGPEGEAGINGAIMGRHDPQGRIYTIIDVPSVDEAVKKIEAAGGKITQPKMTVPGVGYAAYFTDTEGNTLGLIQNDPNAR